MAKQAIGVGSAANDGTGDDLRSGAQKINANFDEIYTALGSGTALSSGISATASAVTLTAPTITGAVGGTQTSATITTLTTAGITGTGGALEITADNNIVEFRGDGTSSGTVGTIQLNCSANSHGQKIQAQPHSANVTNTLTLPAGGNQELVGTAATQTLTGKTLTSPTITGTGSIAGVFTGNITGNVTGNVTGNIDGIVGGNTPAAVTGTTISGTSIAVTGVSGALTLNTVTTTQRNALSAANGMIVYNSTDSKIQAYAGGAWVDLH